MSDTDGDPTTYLLGQATSDDLEDGNLTDKIVIDNLEEVLNQIANNDKVDCNLIYSITDSFPTTIKKTVALHYESTNTIKDTSTDYTYRYISKDYRSTLDSSSKWNSGTYKALLDQALAD